MKSVITSYISLTKPTIVLLFALTGASAMVVEGSLLHNPLKFLIVLAAIIFTAGSANALNMYVDRDIDEIMQRTKRKRALPQKKVTPLQALWFGLILGILATAMLLWFANVLAASIAVATIVFYVCIYTMYLKRRTPYNIVIGGAAGATAPLIGWAAATGHLSALPWLLFAIIFIWTPPHFWALALVIKEDYRKANVPMLPVVAGDSRTRIEILIYSLFLIPLTLLGTLVKAGGLTYTIGGVILGGMFLYLVYNLMKKKTDKSAYGLFGYSIVYLLALFTLLIVGSLAHAAPVTSTAPAASTATSAAASASPSTFDQKFNKLDVGESTDKVQKRLGDPTLREVVEGIEIWHYSSGVTLSTPKKVDFKNKKVIGFSQDEAAIELLNTSKPAVPEEDFVTRKIGDECKVDRQCESKNCHFKICAGKNNCTLVVDDVCANNKDCCTGFCDFGKCKERHW